MEVTTKMMALDGYDCAYLVFVDSGFVMNMKSSIMRW